MIRYESQGITIRKRSLPEQRAYDKQLPEPKRQKQLPFAERVKQVQKVKQMAKDRGLTLSKACEEVGISWENYKSINTAMKNGKTKRN